MDDFDTNTFPKFGVMPKQETEVLKFFAENGKNFNGNGVIVAILDGGCDPGAQGLMVTPEGKPKFIDVIDATGSGDVDTSKTAKLNDDGTVTGLSGIKLKINPKWKNPSNVFKVGMIRAYKFFPKPLVKRVEKIRSEKFGIKKKKYMDSIEGKLDELIKDINKKDISVAEQKSIKAKIDDMKTFKSEIEKISNDKCGPIMDVLCWNDGTEWCCVVDTTNINKYYNCEDMYVNSEVSVDEKTDDTDSDAKMDSYCYINNNGERINDISILTPMINYKKSLKYGTLSDIDLLNYCINIYDDGNIVSIVVPSSSHGSHVAGIIGAYYKDDITRNGMAPGCQMISIKIGDTRLGTMETNQALMRGLNYVKEYKCDLVNMSYGEPSTFPSGAFPNEVDRLVWKYGTIFISSAGNDGPCLSTAGAPQSATNSIVGIGAMFTPNMIKTEYGLCDIPNMNAYTWTSRGPTLDGALGVKICAPGGAISPIPTYNLSKSQLMNGTSMASPNACGNVALLLGILKDKKIKYTPTGIETALINSASNAGIETIAKDMV
eukprot:CAMPEP_0114672178 /NCGR_PEP_ID=MMETSP0191-20121206/42420_1 /TAXON_ID=126664 /ORGANISM="Sorites sp." /LENGTH=545 /DNA_ID=CAMNT_0001933805 /DNA_START=21 /DNA_END=1659 /DNA_ORIENTATION=-